MFFRRRQIQGESFESFLNSLRTEAGKCDFRELKDRFICLQLYFGHHDKLVRDKLLLDPKITLDKAIDICLNAEASKIRKNNLDADSLRAVNKVASVSGFNRSQKYQRNETISRQAFTDCQFCGRRHEPRQCPAYGKICKKCGKRNHFATVYADQHHLKTCIKL